MIFIKNIRDSEETCDWCRTPIKESVYYDVCPQSNEDKKGDLKACISCAAAEMCTPTMEEQYKH